MWKTKSWNYQWNDWFRKTGIVIKNWFYSLDLNFLFIELQFVAVREQLYLERINQLEVKYAEAKVEKSPEYLQPFEELQEALRVREEVAEIVKKLRIENVQCQFEAERCAAKQTYDVSL